MVSVIFARRAYLFYLECSMKNKIRVNPEQCSDGASTGSSSNDNSNYLAEENISEQLL